MTNYIFPAVSDAQFMQRLLAHPCFHKFILANDTSKFFSFCFSVSPMRLSAYFHCWLPLLPPSIMLCTRYRPYATNRSIMITNTSVGFQRARCSVAISCMQWTLTGGTATILFEMFRSAIQMHENGNYNII